MSDLLHFDKAKYAAIGRGLSTKALQKSEIRQNCGRVASGFGLFYGIAATASTYGAAIPIALYCIRTLVLADNKREIIRQELLRRGVQPHKTNSKDFRHGFGAAWLGQPVLPFADALSGDGLTSSSTGGGHGAAAPRAEQVAKETGRQVPGEFVTGTYIKGHRVKK